jgi:hypothetical protein
MESDFTGTIQSNCANGKMSVCQRSILKSKPKIQNRRGKIEGYRKAKGVTMLGSSLP